MGIRLAFVAVVAAALGAWVTRPEPPHRLLSDSIEVQSHPWFSRGHHHEGGGFTNVWPPYRQTSVTKGSLWFLSTLFDRKENRLPSVRPIDVDDLQLPASNVELTWIGHSTLLIRTPNASILVDPIFSERASPLSFAGPKREPALPIMLTDLPPIDVVILSHDHYDHLDHATVETLSQLYDPLFLVPLGLAVTVTKWGARRVAELDWWQYVEIEGIRYHCVPAKHFSGRSLFDRNETLWAGWYIEASDGDTRLFYAGDTGYAPHFTEVRERLGVPQIAVLPIGAYLPPWLMQPVHVNPDEALQAFGDLGSDHMIPVHWGTFDLSEEPLHAPADTLRRLVSERSLEDRVHLLYVGETWRYEIATGGTK